MTFKNDYIPPSKDMWEGRNDAPPNTYFFQLIQMLNLNEALKRNNQNAFALLGFCCDEGIKRNFGREGAAEGPCEIRKILAKLPLQREDITLFDAGDIICKNNELEQSQASLATAISLLLEHRIIPIVIGGGHEVAWGNYQGIAKTIEHKHLGILNFDAHFDMRPLLSESKGTSGTSFLQIAEAHRLLERPFDYNCVGIQSTGNTKELFTTAKKYGVHYLLASDVYAPQQKGVIQFIDRVIEKNEIIYVSLCLDVFAQAFAPGVSAPQPFGLLPWQVIPMLRQIASSGKVISYDLAEYSPKWDIDQRTAKLAAQFIHEMIEHHLFFKF